MPKSWLDNRPVGAQHDVVAARAGHARVRGAHSAGRVARREGLGGRVRRRTARLADDVLAGLQRAERVVAADVGERVQMDRRAAGRLVEQMDLHACNRRIACILDAVAGEVVELLSADRAAGVVAEVLAGHDPVRASARCRSRASGDARVGRTDPARRIAGGKALRR